ncbi:UDP-N-acetylmuramoyl-L-alanyl-D-glutamate--2,6-diaminopimelate ligase [Victivallis sp. Marseille-Q1083]|uniref:UDP-N-acetylmuramoyl-L-alanyl-D-glutamate--2, 6-diaminopimelate ligase n=1 Tax=Victivallis sp. Marseille-Q1083 TaxID=2717288 RepID=UPI00158B3948|nr:UDP-N-acetylmuramoyl-L-alanyl-D-glutamate--2,6-diaminopimelate ligase [Victivallis sp. Marseille-Q1083]
MAQLLSTLLAALPSRVTHSVKYDFVVNGLTNDSRRVKSNYLFCAIRGADADGNAFIPEAIAAGAKVIIHTADCPDRQPNIIYLQVPDAYEAYSRLAAAWFDYPAQKLKLHGITGTNGKTTSAYLLYQLLTTGGRHCGLLSTVEYRLGSRTLPAERTTPAAYELQAYFAEMRDNGVTDVVMEVSSHALAQHRLGLLKFHSAIFTNLTGDHLDYHRTMDNYFAAKQKLFAEHLHQAGTAIINIDDPWGAKLAGLLPKPVKRLTFGETAEADVQFAIQRLSAAGTRFTLTRQGRTRPFQTALIGRHNVYNLTGVILAAHANGLPLPQIAETLEQPCPVPGRLESIAAPRGIRFFVDYAHTDDALYNVLNILRAIAPRRVITVFGCGGDRDRTKRPRMGKVAAEHSDLCIVTSDNPRSETPEAIIADIRTGMPSEAAVQIEPDRRQAIALAYRLAEPEDLILVAGKGHENYQEINHVKHPFDDREVIRRLIGN